MKKLFIIVLVLLSVVGYALIFLNETNSQNSQYLRIHIRANSNLVIDQNVKYEVKNSLVDALYPIVANCNTKDELIENICDNIEELTEVANNSLHKAKMPYSAKISVKSEYFPTRVYNSDLTLNSGVYDALIVELGEAEGDNWWCVIYPPLCFMNINYSSSSKATYSSRIIDMVKKFFS